MQTKAIIFDFFGVVCSETAPVWFKKYFSEEEATRLKDLYFKPVDRGEVLEKELFRQLASLIYSEPELVEQEFRDLIRINKPVVDLIERLKSEYKIGCCTNSPSSFFRTILDKYTLTNLFDEIVVSSENKVAKPDSAIFKIMLEKLQCVESESLFIDDNPQNINSARSLGLETILFTNSDQLTRDLTKRGILN